MSDLPKGWTEVALGDVAEVVSGATPKTKVPEYWDGDVTWATPKDLSSLSGLYLGATARSITEAGLASCTARVLPPQSVLLSSRAPIGLVAINEVPIATNQGFKSLVPGPDLDARYLAHWLRAHGRELQAMGTGATFKEISRSTVSRIRLPLPPLPEQRRIAAILDKGSSLQERALRRREKTDSLLTQAFMMWFPRNQYPTAPIASLGAVATGKTPPTNDTTSFGGPIPFTTPGDLMEKTPARWLSEFGAEKSRVVRGGSALVCCIGATIGKVGIARQSTAFNQQINAVEWDDSIDDAYGYFALRAQSRLIASLGVSTTMPILNKGQFSKLTIPVPPISEQRQFGQFFDTWERQQTSHEAQLQTLEALTRALQSRAFRGEL